METPERVHGQIHCSQCGKLNFVSYDESGLGIDPCKFCGRRLVDVVALLIELGDSDYEFRSCPRCNRANRTDPYCYSCGLIFKDHGWER